MISDAPEGYMEDSRGRFVRAEHVSDYDKLKDDTVKNIFGHALRVQQEIKDFKTDTMGDVYALMEVAAEKYDAKLGGKKGNVSILSFDGRQKIQIAVNETLTFDERLQIAKELVDECLIEWTQDSRTEIKTLVTSAFEVDKQGNISTAKVMSLLKLEINDAKWQRAMKALNESLSVLCSKKYIRFYQRDNHDEKWQGIPLDIAAL
ncbi:MAG TPA: sulfate transporter [Desulfovibrio sp.]|nr:sulfate transporter [Desulfovibrio sp.]